LYIRRQVPHFHHEYVKMALTVAVEYPENSPHLLKLLKKLNDMGIVNDSQTAIGFQRMLEAAEDLELDVPGAQLRLEELMEEARKMGVPISIWNIPIPTANM
jgi:hypothetical protein